jgi:uncharacterized protein YqjF (DUF2071 family)
MWRYLWMFDDDSRSRIQKIVPGSILMQHRAFLRQEHRPWPIPGHPWTWRQSWKELLFAHWPVPATELRSLVPASLEIQQFGGTSWVGVVPFRMTGVMRRPFPDLPGVSAFPELNLRLYVERDGKPGVWFLSLDAGNRLAVWAARRFFHQPYHFADIHLTAEGHTIRFDSSRSRDADVGVQAAYCPQSEIFEARAGTLEHFLAERYCLYAQSPKGELYRGHVHHVPWPLQKAIGQVEADGLVRPFGITLRGEPLLHYSSGVDVVVWPLEPLSS